MKKRKVEIKQQTSSAGSATLGDTSWVRLIFQLRLSISVDRLRHRTTLGWEDTAYENVFRCSYFVDLVVGSGRVGFLQKIIPLHGSILQAGTCQTPSLEENPRWSRVWQYAQKDLWKWEEKDKSQITKSCQDDWIFFNLGLLSSPATSAQGWKKKFWGQLKFFFIILHTRYLLPYIGYLMLFTLCLLWGTCYLTLVSWYL